MIKKVVLIFFGVLFLLVVPLIVIVNVTESFIDPSIYEAEARILVNDDSSDTPFLADINERLASGQSFVDLQRQLIMSKPILSQLSANLNLQQKWGEELNEDGSPLSARQTLDLLRRKVAVESYKNTRIINLKVQSIDPEETALIANELAAVYRDSLLIRARQESRRGLAALQSELEKQKERVDAAEQQVERITEATGVSEQNTETGIDKKALQSLNSDLAEARVEMDVLKVRHAQVQSMSNIVLLYGIENPSLKSLRQEHREAEDAVDECRKEDGEDSPKFRNAKKRLDRVLKQLERMAAGIRNSAESDYQVAKVRCEALQREVQKAQQTRMRKEGKKSLVLNKAQRELEVQRAILDALQKRVVQEGIEMEIPRTSLEIIDPAEPPEYSSVDNPNLYRRLLIAIITVPTTVIIGILLLAAGIRRRGATA